MTIIPNEVLTRWRKSRKDRAASKLADLLELREILVELKNSPIGQIYQEAAEAMGYSKNTLERNIRIIRAYPDKKLVYWIVSGLSFDHIESANFYQTNDKTAMWILDKAIDPGNENGQVMTVDEMIAFSNGEKPRPGIVIRFLTMINRIGDFPKRFGWPEDKTARFTAWVEQGKEFVNEAQDD